MDETLELEIERNPDSESEADETDEKQPFPVYDEKTLNLVPVFMAHPDGVIALKKLGNAIIDKFEKGYEATQEYRERFADMWRIFAGELRPQEGVFKDASNAHIPMMLENLSRLTYRAYSELFGDWSNVVNFLPNGPDDDEVATRLSQHINWQIREQIPEFKRQMHRQMLMFFGPGDVTCHTYWSEEKGRPCVEVLSPDEFVTPYVQVSVMPDWSDVPWRAKILNLYRHELEAYRGAWFGVETVLKRTLPSWDDEPMQTVTREISEVQGIVQDDEVGAPHKVIWYEGWEQLPSQERQRFVQAIVDHRTRTIMRLTIHEQPNWQDKVRFDRQLAELNQYQEAVMSVQQATMQQEAMEQQLAQQIQMQAVGPDAATQLGAELQAQRAAIPPAPMRPGWMKDDLTEPTPPRMEPISLFSHGVCLEPLVGNLGLGYGRVQADLNRAVNTSFQQYLNGLCLANGRALITSELIDFAGGKFKIGPAEHNRVTGVSGAKMREEIIEFKFDPPDPSTIQAVEKLMQAAESSIQAPGILSGEPGKSGETYRGAMARIEQATKQLAVATRKDGDMVEQIIKHIAYLNSVFMEDEEIVLVTNHLGKTSEVAVGRKLYERNYRVALRADLRFATLAQRIAEADELLGLGASSQFLAQNQAFQWHAIKRSLEARGRHDMIPMLGPEPPPPATTFGLPPPMPPAPPGADPNAPPAEGQPAQPAPQMLQ